MNSALLLQLFGRYYLMELMDLLPTLTPALTITTGPAKLQQKKRLMFLTEDAPVN